MKNPYLELHHEFRKAGADILISSGQACVLFGIAAFSKDGDWIIKEHKKSCDAVLKVLSQKSAKYRLGAPLDPHWLKKGLTSHFEFKGPDNIRIRIDICSRPPRVSNIKHLWEKAIRTKSVDLVDIENLILLKQTKRIRDYSIIGALAETAGFNENIPEIALQYLQDFDLLNKAVKKWPKEAKECNRKAVRLILNSSKRREIIIELALEQDEKIEADKKRINKLYGQSKNTQRIFIKMKKRWEEKSTPLLKQHEELITAYHKEEKND